MTHIDCHIGDITRIAADAIVNAANEALLPGGGVCGAIHAAAGPRLAAACRDLGRCPTGSAVVTPGFDLPARHVIHAVGPRWHGGDRGEPALLRACYAAVFELCRSHGFGSVALPAISTGIFRYPLAAATEIAVAAAREAAARPGRLETILFCCFSEEVAQSYRALLGASGGS